MWGHVGTRLNFQPLRLLGKPGLRVTIIIKLFQLILHWGGGARAGKGRSYLCSIACVPVLLGNCSLKTASTEYILCTPQSCRQSVFCSQCFCFFHLVLLVSRWFFALYQSASRCLSTYSVHSLRLQYCHLHRSKVHKPWGYYSSMSRYCRLSSERPNVLGRIPPSQLS